MIEVISKDVGDVREKRGGEYKKIFENYFEDWIKLEMGVDDI